MNMQVDTSHPLPLRAVYPSLYDTFSSLLEQEHLHIYDTRSFIKKGDAKEVKVQFQYGENFHGEIERTFKESDLEQESNSVMEFIKQAVAQCRDAVIEDYRAFMKVEP